MRSTTQPEPRADQGPVAEPPAVRSSSSRLARARAAGTTKTSARLGVARVALAALPVVVWQVLISVHVLSGRFFGSPAGALAVVASNAHGVLLHDIAVTSEEAGIGLLAGTVLGSIVGLVIFFLPFTSAVVEPHAVAINGLPKIALGPLLIIWLGAGLTSKVVLAFVSTVIVAYLAAAEAASSVDQDQINLFRSLRATNRQLFMKLLVPAAVPWMLTAARMNIGFALVGAVVGEFISAQAGLGYLIQTSGNLFDLNTVWAGIAALTAVAGAAFILLRAFERVLARVGGPAFTTTRHR